MNRNHIFFYFILVILVFSVSCSREEESYVPPSMVTEIIPSQTDDDNSSGFYKGSAFSTDSEKPFIVIGPEETLINTLTINLDLDTHEEQILVLKRRSAPEGRIRIAVADYSNVTNGYVRAWESETLAENIRSFMVHLEDLIGNHNSEIVCSGRDSEGRTTLDVFWKNTSDNNLSFQPVFNKAAKGTIEINQQERDRGYHQGLKDGVSYTITVTFENYDANENLELIRTIYYWDFPAKKYVLLSTEPLESTDITKNQLSSILEGDENNFFDFIDGPWYNGEQIIYFDTIKQNSTFFKDDIQENYEWINAYKVLSNLLYIHCKNEIINYIENEIYVRVIDLDEISITVRDIDNQTHTKNENDIWTKKYNRMDGNMRTGSVKTLDSVIDESNLPVLSGQYISDSGDIIEFYGSDFYMKNSFEEIHGGFAVYSADFDILNLKLIDSKGLVYDERSFTIDYREEKKENFIERTLILTPGTLSIHGFQVSGTEFLRFTQIETLELDDEKNQ